ncbi:MAG: PD40 domain-containing protein [Saprospiraceae bacterium]|nr:PD40 domain-containing protein [Saprospiraceae bacterium]
MNRILLSLFFLCSLSAAFSQAKKWDVNNPKTPINYKDISFTTDEGTWMCVDVSPDGKTVAFDLLGDIYTMPITGGNATCIRSGLAWEIQPRFSPDGKKVLFTSDAGGGDNIWMMNPDGSEPKQITKESFRLLNNATWVNADYFVARKHFTSTRSLGAGELWMYHVTGGDGVQLTKRKNDQQDLNEPSVSSDGRYVYYSEDMYGGGFFQYNKNPNVQIFAVRRYDRQTGKVEDVTGGSGGACRPQISRDGKWLAFVRRVEIKTSLFVLNLETGEEFPVDDMLDKDQQEAWTIFGCYPGFSWADAENIVLWKKGKLFKINALQTANAVKNGIRPDPAWNTPIPFSCQVSTKVAETQRVRQVVYQDEITVHAIRQASTSPDGTTLLFNAAGKLYTKNLKSGAVSALLNNGLKNDEFQFEGAYSNDGKSVVFINWNDETLSEIKTASATGGNVQTVSKDKGIFRTPRFSPDGKKIVYRKQGGDDELGFTYCNKPGIYVLDLATRVVQFITESGENPQFSTDGKRILVTTGGYLFGGFDKSLRSFDLTGNDEKVLAKSRYSNQWAPSPDGNWLAFTELHKAYVCAMPMPGQPIDISGDMGSVPVTLVSKDAGYNLHWSGDSKQLHFTLGDEYFTIDLNKRFSFLPGAPDSLPALDSTGMKIGLKLAADKPDGALLFDNARIITCEGDQVIEKGVVLVKRNKIEFVGTKAAYQKAGLSKPDKVIDCTGKTIMPGIIDAHAHSGNFRYGLSPQKQWEYFANLAYGVTTMHDPSANSEMVFSHSEMLKTGRMVGPRLFSTGTILYGADGDFKAPVNSLDDARAALRRTKAWGAFSVKSYNQPRREQRQQVMAAAKELDMLVVPEGGSFFAHNLTQIVDGHTTIEHNIPVAPLYSDVIKLWGNTKTHNTPTLIVNYGSLNGEYYWYQNTDVWAKKRLLAFTPKHIVNERSRHITKAPDEEYQNGHILTSKSLKKLQDAGVNINLGAHGQLQGLGAHWELWMLQQGGMSNLQAIRCATINGAISLGMDTEIGSIKAGKLADLLVLDANPIDNIRNSESIRYVMVNGRLYNPDTMNEIGNYDKKRSKFWFEMPGGETGAAGVGHSCTETKCVCGH